MFYKYVLYLHIICKQIVIILSCKNIRRCNITKDVSVKSLLKSAVLWNVKRAKLFLYTPRRYMGSNGVVPLILNTEVSGQLHSLMALPSGKVLLHKLDRRLCFVKSRSCHTLDPTGNRSAVLPTHFSITIPTTLSQSTNCPSQKTLSRREKVKPH